MPRDMSLQQGKVLTKRRYTTATRVRVKDSTGTFQDLRTFLGKNWVARVSYATDIDDQTASATVELFRDRYAISLAPLVETSKANLLTGSYAPLIDAMREIIIETAPLPEGVAVASGDWIEVFRGFIDRPSWGGKGKNSLTLECRDLASPLTEIVLEKEGRADGSRYGLDPTGRPMEEVMQDVLDDWAAPAGYTIVLYTPTGTLVDPRPIAERSGWNIKAWPNVAKGQSVMDALKALANFIGYDVRVRWSSVTNTHRLEVFNPPRSNTTPDVTIGPGAIRDIDRLEIDAASVRNALVVTYQTNPDDEETRTSTSTATDATSIARYRRRWMEVCPAGSAAIDTGTEAAILRDIILSDLKDPKAEMIVESNYRPDLVLNDLVRWSPDNKHFTANQDFACVGLRHRIEPDGKATTQIASRGRPCGQFLNWLQIAAAPGRGAWTKTDAGPAPNVTLAATVGGLTATVSSNIVDRDLLHFEYHVSTSSGFTPDRSAVSTTRVARGQMTRVEVLNLTPGTTYYVKVLVVRRDGVVSAASAQQFTIPVRLGSALLDKLDYLELKDMDVSPVADRRLRVIDGEIRSADTSNVEGQYIRGSSLKEGTGPLTKLSAAGLLDNITSIVARAITDLTGNLPGNRLTEGTGPLTNLSSAGVFNSIANITTKTLDLITDGVTYARVLAAALSAGKVNLAAGSAGLAGQLPEAQLGDLAVSAAKIQANAVTNAKILDGAVTNAKVDAAAGIVGTKLAGGAGVLTALETGTGRLVDPEIKDGTGAVHRKLKNVGGKFNTTDSSNVDQPTVWAAKQHFENVVAMTPPIPPDGNPYAWLWDCASANEILNPSFENNVTDGWTADANVTVTRDNSIAVVWGSYCAKLVRNATVGDFGIRSTGVANGAGVRRWAFAIWARGAAATTPAIKVVIERWNGTAWSTAVTQSWTLTDSFDRYSTYADVDGATYTQVRAVVTIGTVSSTVFLDGAQLEDFTATFVLDREASSYIDGERGPGYAWAGTAHNSRSTRQAGVHEVGPLRVGENVGPLIIMDDGLVRFGDRIRVGTDYGQLQIDGPNGRGGRATLQTVGPAKVQIEVKSQAGVTIDGSGGAGAGSVNAVPGTSGFFHVGAVNSFFHAYKTGAQSTSGTANTPTKVTWDATELNPGSRFSTSLEQFNAPEAGVYEFTCGLNVNLLDQQAAQIELYKNGSSIKRLDAKPSSGTHNVQLNGSSGPIVLAAGDLIEIYVAASGATRAINVGQTLCYFAGKRIG